MDKNDFLKEDVRSGYLINTSTKHAMLCQLNLLEILINICKKNNISYFVDAGSLLGTIRHGGFIPWDDDIDVMMTRDNYEQFCSIAPQHLPENVFLQTPKTDSYSLRQHAQLRLSNTTMLIKADFRQKYNRGIFIDIFPYDKVPCNTKFGKKYLKKIVLLNKYVNYYSAKRRYFFDVKFYVKKIILFFYITRFGGKKSLNRIYEKEVTKYKNLQCDYYYENVVLFAGRRFVKFEPKWFESDPIEKDFEFLKVFCPFYSDEVLKATYGNDYMIPKHTATVHGEVFIDTEKSFKYYDNIKKYRDFMKLFDNNKKE